MHPLHLPISELKPALTGLAKVVNRNATPPVLQMVHIERTKDGWLCLTTTDLDRFVTVRLEQPSQGDPIAILVSIDGLQRIVKACGKTESLQLIATNDKQVMVRFEVAGHFGEQPIQSLPPGEFPSIPKVRGNAVPLPDHVRTSLHEAMACASSDETRYVINGAFIDTGKPNAGYIVGTDGRHLYSSNSFSLPLKTSLNLPKHKFLGWREFNLDGEWQLKVGESIGQGQPPWVQISSRRWRYITKQINGNYPAWKQVVPESRLTRTLLELDPNKLEEVLRIIELLPCHDEKFRTIGISWREGRLCLMGKESTSGEWIARSLSLLKGEGADVTVFCNRTLLSKALQFGLTSIHLIDKISPLKFTSAGKQLIIMPIREEAAHPRREDKAEKPSPPPVAEKPASPWPPAPEVETLPAPASIPPNTPVPSPQMANPFEDAQQQLQTLRDWLRGSLDAVAVLSTTLKLLRSDRRNTNRELQALQTTVRHLQKVPTR